MDFLARFTRNLQGFGGHATIAACAFASKGYSRTKASNEGLCEVGTDGATRADEGFNSEMTIASSIAVMRRMLEAGPDGFEGGMNARKYKNLTEVSKATATRDLQDLAGQGVLLPLGAGRSTRYTLNL